MKGSIQYQSDRNRWRVVWYDEKAHKNRFIYRYEGSFMPCSAFKMENGHLVLDKKNRPIPDIAKCTGYKLAEKLRALIQGRWEQAQRGECVFRIEEFTKDGWTDTIEWYHKWIQDIIEPSRKPGTVKAYKSYARTWIEPFFTKYPVRLHEIEYDILMKFLNFIIDGLEHKAKNENPKTALTKKIHKEHPELNSPELCCLLKEKYDCSVSESWIRRVIASEKKHPTKESVDSRKNHGKTALNVLSTVHKMMKFAHKSKRIAALPPFPEKSDYRLKGKRIDYLTPQEYYDVFAKIPAEHKPIFMFLRLHFRRPGEACALHKIDFDPINSAFRICRAISARKLVDSVKTNWQKPKDHYIACDPDFTPIAKRLLNENSDSPYLFVNSRARSVDGKRYTLESIRNIWYRACDDAGIRRIWPYRGVKHTSCMEHIEAGGTEDSLMILTDHANRESVRQYFDITLRRKRLAQQEAKMRLGLQQRQTSTKSSQEAAKVIFIDRKQ